MGMGLNALATFSRALGKPPAWERLVRAVAAPGKMRGLQPYLKSAPEGYDFRVDPSTLIGWYVHFFGTYEPEVRTQIRSCLRPGGVAFDVGANVGWHTLLMARAVLPGGAVHAFEPNDSTRRLLLEAVEHNCFSHVNVSHHAVADQNGAAGFVAPAAGTLWDGTGRLVRERNGRTREVPCMTLDAFTESHRLGRLDLIKIDVEGWELAVLRGAQRSIDSFRPRILFEYDPAYVVRCGGTGKEIVDFFRGLRYDLWQLRARSRLLRLQGPATRAMNLLATPCEKKEL